ncbi:hypothetical protein V1509DRAFT_620980 [Lipomyces kononenkoae]
MGFSDIMKNGWHPEKNNGTSSSSSSSKGSSSKTGGLSLGKFTGSLGSSSNNSYQATREPSKPISELTDAKLFPPPPQHRDFHPDAGSAQISPEYSYLYQPAIDRKRQEEQRQTQQQQWRQSWQPGQAPAPQQYHPTPAGQPQYQQPGPAPAYQQPGQPAYQPPAPSPVSAAGGQPGYQPQQQAYQAPAAAQRAYQSPIQPPQQPYQTPKAQSPPLPQRGPLPSLPPRNPIQQAPSHQPVQQQAAYQPPYQQYPPRQSPSPASVPTYQSSQQQYPGTPAYQNPTVASHPSPVAQTAPSSYGQPTQPFVRGHAYSQSVADGRSGSPATTAISQPTPVYPNFASEISRARAGLSSPSPGLASTTGQRVPSMHRHTQSTSNLGKKAPPPPPPKPKNPALRGSPTPPAGFTQSSLPGAFPEPNASMENNTEMTSSRPPFPARPNNDNSSTVAPAKPARPNNDNSTIAPAKPLRPGMTAAPVVGETGDDDDEQWRPPQVDLELDKKWYSVGNNPIKLVQLPSFLSGMTYGSSIAIAGNTKTIMLSVRFPDLSRTKFRIEVDRYDDNNVSAQRLDYPPPAMPGVQDLEAAATGFGENVARFAEANVGHQVGDGECWTLAREALKSSGAMPSCGLVHGVEIWALPTRRRAAAHNDSNMLRRGDVLQFKSARFKTVDPASGRITGEKYVGAPDHTAVVVCVHSAAAAAEQGVVVTVLEQNVGGVRNVMQGSYVFGDMVEGSVVAYRPFWQEWAGELETSWP